MFFPCTVVSTFTLGSSASLPLIRMHSFSISSAPLSPILYLKCISSEVSHGKSDKKEFSPVKY